MSARPVSVAASLIAVALLGYLGPIQSVLWNGADAPRWAAALPWVAASIQAAQVGAPGAAPYDLFGRSLSLAYVALLVAAWSLRRARPYHPAGLWASPIGWRVWLEARCARPFSGAWRCPR